MSDSPLQIAVTGAGGFVGGAFVRTALAAGHRVRAILRRGSSLPFSHERLVVLAVGLDDAPPLVEGLSGCDAVVHIAATMRGDYAEQFQGTVTTTQGVLAAMDKAGVRKLVGVSSLSVYDFTGPADGARLDEASPLETRPETRGAYARCKGLQEALYRGFGAAAGHTAVIVRPGIIYDEGRLWDYFLGRALGGGAWLAMGPDAELPLIHVEDVATALLRAVEVPSAAGETVNLIEDQPPRRFQLIEHLNAAGTARKRILRFPWGLHRSVAGAIRAVNRLLFGGRLHLPGLLDATEMDVRFKPRQYDNQRARRLLGWEPRRRALQSSRAD